MERLLPLEFVSAMAGPDRRRQRIAFGLLDEIDRLDRTSQAGMFFIHTDVFLDATQDAELRFHTASFGLCTSYDLSSDHDGWFECLMTGVSHSRTGKTCVNAFVTRSFH